jgi:hypothetical protein
VAWTRIQSPGLLWNRLFRDGFIAGGGIRAEAPPEALALVDEAQGGG